MHAHTPHPHPTTYADTYTPKLSLTLSLSHTHTHTHSQMCTCMCIYTCMHVCKHQMQLLNEMLLLCRIMHALYTIRVKKTYNGSSCFCFFYLVCQYMHSPVLAMSYSRGICPINSNWVLLSWSESEYLNAPLKRQATNSPGRPLISPRTSITNSGNNWRDNKNKWKREETKRVREKERQTDR